MVPTAASLLIVPHAGGKVKMGSSYFPLDPDGLRGKRLVAARNEIQSVRDEMLDGIYDQSETDNAVYDGGALARLATAINLIDYCLRAEK